ncbi:hypothetical protein OIU78_027185 [Salix suchowensis]|nr:hypothetical protein OIU78_027185 [Salix suchowensis]
MPEALTHVSKCLSQVYCLMIASSSSNPRSSIFASASSSSSLLFLSMCLLSVPFHFLLLLLLLLLCRSEKERKVKESWSLCEVACCGSKLMNFNRQRINILVIPMQ